jgi:hypothetical protein
MWETVVPIALAAAIMTSLVNVASRIKDIREAREPHSIAASFTGSVEPLIPDQRRSPHVVAEPGA